MKAILKVVGYPKKYLKRKIIIDYKSLESAKEYDTIEVDYRY